MGWREQNLSLGVLRGDSLTKAHDTGDRKNVEEGIMVGGGWLAVHCPAVLRRLLGLQEGWM